MIHVAHLAPRGCWDENILTQLLGNHLYPTGLEYEHHDGWPNIYDTGVIAVIPGRYWHTRAAEISEAMARYRWVLAFRTGDEEDLFDIDAVTHPNIKWWVQTPRADKYYRGARWFGVGWTPAFNNPPFDPDTPAARKRPLDVYLAGQNTHCRRNQAFKTLNTMQEHPDYRKIRIQADPTPGFTQGVSPAEYAKTMVTAKIGVAPAGAVSPDSFRFWEALQAHTLPIVDGESPLQSYYASQFWSRMFGDGSPLSVLTTYAQLPGYIEDLLAGWPANGNRVTAWWMREKRKMTLDLLADLESLGAI